MIFVSYFSETQESCVRHFERKCIGEGTKCQGDLPNGGMQCTCNALVFLCLQSISGFETTAESIDKVLHLGTELFDAHIKKEFGTLNLVRYF